MRIICDTVGVTLALFLLWDSHHGDVCALSACTFLCCACIEKVSCSLCRAFSPFKTILFFLDGPVSDILERVAPGDDVSDFSDLSGSNKEWTATNNYAPGNSSDNEEAEHSGGSVFASSSPPGRNWKKALLEIAHPDFSGTFTEPDDLAPKMLFKRLLTDDMLVMLVEQTNLYSTQKYGKSVNTSVAEVEQYICMYLKMGLVQMSNVQCYWEQGSRPSPIADTMSRNRFLKLMACLHVEDNLQVPEEEKQNKAWKLRPWIVALQRNLEKIEQLMK